MDFTGLYMKIFVRHTPSKNPGSATGSRAPKHHARVQENYPYPPRTPTLRIDKQEYGQTRKNDKSPPQP
jgi:hypothetical protein